MSVNGCREIILGPDLGGYQPVDLVTGYSTQNLGDRMADGTLKPEDLLSRIKRMIQKENVTVSFQAQALLGLTSA